MPGRQPVNFKDTSDEDYRLYRLLQAPSYMVPVYQQRIREAGKYRGAIIFPEQFIACYGNGVFYVAIDSSQDSLSMNIQRYRKFSLWTNLQNRSEPITCMSDVIRIERDEADNRDSELFIIRRTDLPKDSEYLRARDFLDTKIHGSFWFSNKSDALSFTRSKLVFPN